VAPGDKSQTAAFVHKNADSGFGGTRGWRVGGAVSLAGSGTEQHVVTLLCLSDIAS